MSVGAWEREEISIIVAKNKAILGTIPNNNPIKIRYITLYDNTSNPFISRIFLSAVIKVQFL
jgi:hypothetical protein